MKRIVIYLSVFSLYVVMSSFKNPLSQAQVHLENDSGRTMYIKVMQQGGGIHQTASVSPYSKKVLYFSETNYYYIKTKATRRGSKPVYSKGNAFQVYNGYDGYSVITITYTINETNALNPMDGKEISEAEFERDF